MRSISVGSIKPMETVDATIAALHARLGPTFAIVHDGKRFEADVVRSRRGQWVLRAHTEHFVEGYDTFRVTFQRPATAVIDYVQKTDRLSGSRIVAMLLQVLRHLGVCRARLEDAAKVECDGDEIGLSERQLLTKGRCFYCAAGFRYVPRATLLFEGVDAHDAVLHHAKVLRMIRVRRLVRAARAVMSVAHAIISSAAFGECRISVYEGFSNRVVPADPDTHNEKVRRLYRSFSRVVDAARKHPAEATVGALLAACSCDDYRNVRDALLLTDESAIAYGRARAEVPWRESAWVVYVVLRNGWMERELRCASSKSARKSASVRKSASAPSAPKPPSKAPKPPSQASR